jgi:hypothetical protein
MALILVQLRAKHKFWLISVGLVRLQLTSTQSSNTTNMPKWSELYAAITEGEVLMPGDNEYAASVKRWSVAAEINPVC